MKRFLSMLLCAAMMLSMFPASAFADDASGADAEPVIVEESMPVEPFVEQPQAPEETPGEPVPTEEPEYVEIPEPTAAPMW